MDKTNKPYMASIDGNQIFSAEYVFIQMQAQSRRIDRVELIAVANLAIHITFILTRLLLMPK